MIVLQTHKYLKKIKHRMKSLYPEKIKESVYKQNNSYNNQALGAPFIDREKKVL